MNTSMTTITQPSIVLPKFLEADPCLSNNAKHLLALLDDYKNRITGQCNPRIIRLATDLSLSRSTVLRALRELQQWGLVIIRHTQRVNQYIIAAREMWAKMLAQARIKFSKPVEKAPGASPPAEQREGEQNPSPRVSKWNSAEYQNGTLDPPVSLLTEPTDRTYLSNNEGLAADRSVHHAEPRQAPATPALVVDKSLDEDQMPARLNAARRPLRSRYSEALWQELVAVHPQPGKALAALEEIDRLLHENWQQAAKLVATLRSRHQQWREYWATLEAGAFIPQLWRWVKEGEWIVAPVIRTPARRAFEPKAERLERISSLSEQRAIKADAERHAKGIFYPGEVMK
jgi:hypothetical protein